MEKGKRKSSRQTYWIIGGVVLFVFLLSGIGLFLFLGWEEQDKKSRVAIVSLLKPPAPLKEKPPPPIKEKIPEPEVSKKEVMEEVREVAKPDEAPRDRTEDKPAGDQLGLDAQGGAGSDSFGLVGKKGGRDLLTLGKNEGEGSGQGVSVGKSLALQQQQTIGGAKDPATLLRRFAWYNQLVQEEMKRAVRKRLEENGGIPKGKLEALVQIV
ncbi:MAG: hypothetical protein HXY45_01030, partial [Syntrophaceae bacterium]|nr:hypothetical protein [Syntrophaceae bacterium]